MHERVEVPDVDAVASRLGLQSSGGRYFPCLSCGAKRDPKARRGPLWTKGPRWACGACGERGDTLTLISWSLHQQAKAKGAQFVEVLRWLDSDLVRESIAEAKERPSPVKTRAPEAELRALLQASTPVARTADPDTIAFLRGKGISTRTPAVVLPPSSHRVYNIMSKTWWPSGRAAMGWRLAVPAFTGSGTLAGMHARSVTRQSTKTLWAKGVDSAALLFANGLALELLRGQPASVERVLIVEGFSDYLYAAGQHLPGLAVFGLESGSAPALRLIRFPEVPIFCSPHNDGTGDNYAAAVAAAVSPRLVRSLPLHRTNPPVAA